MQETGAHVRREAWVAEFANPDSDAILDIWAFGCIDVRDLLVDVTIRHPRADTYQPAASQRAGAAAKQAEIDKEDRYPAAQGRSVTPFAVETLGRLGEQAEATLQMLAAVATRRAAMRGQAPCTTSFLRKWRICLDAALHRGVALCLQSAHLGLAGRKHAAAHAPLPAM